jgi:hypothetical protein
MQMLLLIYIQSLFDLFFYCHADVIGVFHELGYTQTVPGNRKMQINFKLKDIKLNLLPFLFVLNIPMEPIKL